MNFHFHGKTEDPLIRWFSAGFKEALLARGELEATDADLRSADVKLVVNLLDPRDPRPFRRKGQGTFVAGVMVGEQGRRLMSPERLLQAAYPQLVRSLSNLLIYLMPGDGREDRPERVAFITPEQGCYSLQYIRGEDEAFFAAVYQRIAPIASARLVIDNIFEPDLERELWEGDELTQALGEAGKKLDELNLLPAPFPLERYLPPREMAHLRRLYSMGGLSYGNLSCRKDERRFWMSASGVDKARLVQIGRDILMVKAYDSKRNAMILSVPPGIEPRRVSVDAIEHWMIYTENPGVGAIVHVHAWMDGVPQTEINYPCGTYELALAVATKVREAPDPSRTVVGLKNHGLTITGRDLADIFERIEGRILPSVPMTS